MFGQPVVSLFPDAAIDGYGCSPAGAMMWLKSTAGSRVGSDTGVWLETDCSSCDADCCDNNDWGVFGVFGVLGGSGGSDDCGD